MEWDASELGSCGRFLRLRTRLDLTKPLQNGSMTLSSNGQPSKVFFKYERLQDYCYICGLLEHTIRDCSDNGDNYNEEDSEGSTHNNYGPWLRASPFKKYTTTVEGQSSTTLRKKLIFKTETTEVPSPNSFRAKIATEAPPPDYDHEQITRNAQSENSATDTDSRTTTSGDNRTTTRLTINATQIMEWVLLGLHNCSIEIPREVSDLLTAQENNLHQNMELNATMHPTQATNPRIPRLCPTHEQQRHHDTEIKSTPNDQYLSPCNTSQVSNSMSLTPKVAHNPFNSTLQQKSNTSGPERMQK